MPLRRPELRFRRVSPEWTALAALLVLVILAIRLTTAGVDDINLVVAVCFGALGLLAVWILVSGHGSHAPARAALEYGRMLPYVAVFVLFGSLGRSDGRARVLLGALAVGAFAVAVTALAVWLLPTTFLVGTAFDRARLAWPTSYWNATGLMAGLG
jgi:hypothetical protein